MELICTNAKFENLQNNIVSGQLNCRWDMKNFWRDIIIKDARNRSRILVRHASSGCIVQYRTWVQVFLTKLWKFIEDPQTNDLVGHPNIKTHRTNGANFQFHPIFESVDDLTMWHAHETQNASYYAAESRRNVCSTNGSCVIWSEKDEWTFFPFHVHIDYIFHHAITLMRIRFVEWINGSELRFNVSVVPKYLLTIARDASKYNKMEP